MSTFFSRLPARHDVRKYTKAVASHMLDDDSRVVIAIGNLSVASLREYCAALLWLNDNSPILLSDIESLSSNERSTLCTLLGLVETGVQVAVSRRILASLAGHAPPPPPPPSTPSFYTLLLPFHPELDGSTPAIRRLAQNCSFACQPGDRRSAQENAAMRLWCEHGFLQESDVTKLSIPLRVQIEQAHNVDSRWPDHLRANTLFALVDAWRKSTGRQAIPPPPSPALPLQPPVYVPPGSASGSSLPQPGSQFPMGGTLGMHMPPGGGGGIFNTNFYGTGHHGGGTMGPLTLGLHNLSLNVNAPQPLFPNPLAGALLQAPNTGLLNPFDWLRSEGEKRLAMLQQLHAPVVDLLSDAEQKRMLNANKVSTVMSPFGTTGEPAKTALTTIYAEYPWNQLLRLYPGHGATAQGRQVQIALRVDAASFGGPNEQLVRDSRIKAESILLDAFDAAFNSRRAAECFLHKEAITRHMVEQARLNALSAAEDASRFPQQEFGAIAMARRTQHEQMPLFLHSVAEQISKRSEGLHKQRSQVGMWKQFIDGWRHSAQASAQREAALALTADWGDCDDTPCGARAPDSDSDDGSPAPRISSRDKGTPRQTPKPKPAKEKSTTSPIFPSSKEVIGAALGLDPPGGDCRHCKNPGHFHTDCPVRWAKRGHPLPGFSSNGRRIRGAWEDGNPTKETFSAWVRFWKDPALFGSGPTVRDGAPDLQAIKKAAREGPPS